jgi:excinuclease ABC subunit A
MSTRPCPVCQGKRLNEESRAVAIAGMGLDQVAALPVTDLLEWVKDLTGDSDRWPETRNGGA